MPPSVTPIVERIALWRQSSEIERPDSDVDVCVIVPDSLSSRVIARAIYRSLYGFARPVDVVVVTTSRWERHRKEIGLIYRAIDRENVLLYAA